MCMERATHVQKAIIVIVYLLRHSRCATSIKTTSAGKYIFKGCGFVHLHMKINVGEDAEETRYIT